ncbi:unnamed protein product [Alopecurus aequalis]
MSRTPGKTKRVAEPAPLEQFVTPVVTDGEGRRLTRTLRTTDELKVLMNFYYEMVPTVKRVGGFFSHRRSRILGWETPEMYGMKDGDVIQFLPTTTPDMLVTPVLQDFRGRSFTRTMRKTDRLQGLMDFYTAMVPSDGVFMYRGEAVSGEQTPADLGMKDWDRIYFVPRRRGEVQEEKSDVYITVKVWDSEITFYRTMRMTEKLEVLMDLYRTSLAAKRDSAFMFNGAFLFDGRQLRGKETPAELKMEDGDEVDYFPVMYG